MEIIDIIEIRINACLLSLNTLAMDITKSNQHPMYCHRLVEVNNPFYITWYCYHNLNGLCVQLSINIDYSKFQFFCIISYILKQDIFSQILFYVIFD